ncbi:hypothetical protein DVH24_017034 [Malus domestica]|uniref:Gnk2-homologous domain-containing protein n=1 Tax=Malus domestica TaxID=3750 RepID=A0A498IXG7_MALDO|nr:hypothetical protein DVH24_017034 [Malus domestica]
MMNHQKLKSMTTLLLIFSFFTVPSFLTSTEAAYLSHACSNTGTFTPDSTFQSNLNRLFSTLSSNANRSTGFYNASVKTPNNAVYGLFLCRGDVLGTDACETCVATATGEFPQLCPIEKEAVIWYDDCMLRYSYVSFFSTSAENPGLHMLDSQDVTEPTRFNQVLTASMNEVATEAANDADKFATKKMKFSDLITLYTLGQCTQDLSATTCHRCFKIIIAQLPSCCSGKQGGRVLFPSCNVRYEIYPFYAQNGTAPEPAPGDPPPKGEYGVVLWLLILPLSQYLLKKKNPNSYSCCQCCSNICFVSYLDFFLRRSRLSPYIIIVGSILAFIAVTVVLGYCFARRRAVRNNAPSQENGRDDTKTLESLQFDLGTIENATNKFSDNNNGYMAPEYAMRGLYSIKSDVFSFGVLLLEIITGKKNFLGFHPTNGAPTLIGYAWKLWNEGKLLELMDPLLKGLCSPNEFLRYVHIGLLCVQEDAKDRPTMSSVVLMLKSETISLSKPERPAFFTGRCIDHHDQVAVSAHNCSVNGLTISNVVAR